MHADPLSYLALLAVAAIAGALAGFAAGRSSARRLLSSSILEGLLREDRVRRALKGARGRVRRRYIVFEVASSEPVGAPELERALSEAARELYGASGAPLLGLKLVYYDERRRRGVLRVRHRYKYHALALLGLVRTVNGRRVLLIPLMTTGTVKRAKRLIEAL